MLIALMFSSVPASATPDTQKVKDATAIWNAAIEPGITPALPRKYKVVKRAQKTGNVQRGTISAVPDGLFSATEVVPGTNMSAMILDKLKVSEQVTPETTALFGETIDLNTGSMSLQQVDISIPGNFNIPVEFRRIYKGGSYSFYSNLSLGEWNIGIPSISTTVIYDPITSNRYSGNWGSGAMCSGALNPGIFGAGPTSLIAPGDYWSGETLDIPGVISEKVQVNSNGRFIKNWKFSCITITAFGGTMEGLRAKSPEGSVYEFAEPKLIPTTPMTAANGYGLEELVPKFHAFLLLSKITDRFGNTVHYNYTDGKLTSISSSDDRNIVIEYETNPYQKARVKTVTANGHSWKYRYRDANHPNNNDSLTEVERPDGRKWQFNLQSAADIPSFHLKATERDYFYNLVSNGETNDSVLVNITERQCIDLPAGVGRSGYLIHPNGARLDLTFGGLRFGRTQVPNVLSNYRYIIHANDLCFVANSIISKTLSGPGLPAMTWQYNYSQNKGAWANTINGERDVGERLTGLAAIPDGYDALDLRSTGITTPDGAKTVHIFSRRWDHTDGQEVGTEYYDTNGTTLLRRIERKFAFKATGGSVEMTSFTGNELGTPYFVDNPAPHENYINKTSEQVFSYAGGVLADTYTTAFPKDDYNIYGLPTKTVESNSLGFPERTTTTTYYHDTANWVLNQETNRQISQSGKSYSERSASYYAATAAEKSLLKTESRNGQLFVYSHQYHADGTLKKTTYAMTSIWVEFGDYKRGKPQSITLPNRYDNGSFTVGLGMNNSGTIAWATDLNGNRTDYRYDSLNRLTLIDPQDSRWLNTSISYDADSDGTGALQQNITRGNYHKTITLDALMQPMLSKEWDSNNETDTVRFINQRFNAYGKTTFTSVPSSSSSENYGSATVYDGLQRVSSQTNTVNGDLSFNYGSNNSITVTNGKGGSTTTQYLAYGSPATELAKQISQPEGVTTTINYNEANLPETITQGGITEERRYDSAMRLCLQKRPETGIKVMAYNTLGQVTSYAEGLSNVGSGCPAPSAYPSSRVHQIYDRMGDPRITQYPDRTLTKTLDRQGNLTELWTGNNLWTYDYNSLNQPDMQKLQLDTKTYIIDLAYNNHGHLQSKTYGGSILNYEPNALGQPTKVEDNQTYASNVLYHPNGQLKSYSYGNGLSFNQTLDTEFRPYERQVKSGSSLLSAQRYHYDNNDNLDTITDLVASSQSISLTFDGLDRLATASGVWGSGSFGYDSLGNINNKVLGTQNLVYSYDVGSNRLNTVTGGYSFSYDDRGNVINNGKRAFQYNRSNQLTSSGTISYLYDGHGRRVKKTGSSNSYSVYDLSGTLLLTDGPNGQMRYIHLGKELIAKTGAAPALEDKPGYTGHVEDKDLSLTYMQQRYYDPVIGRFYSNDPVDAFEHMKTENGAHGFNRYAYANNNPYKFTDPTGMSSYNPQRMAVDMARSPGEAKANHASYTTARSGSDTTKIVAGTALSATGNLVAGTIMLGEGLTGESLVEQGALAFDIEPELASNIALTFDILGGLKGFAEGIAKIGANFGPESVDKMAEGAVETAAQGAVLGNDMDNSREEKR